MLLRSLMLFVAFSVISRFRSVPAEAALVRALSYQGSLMHPDCAPVLEGAHELTFRLWDAQHAAAQQWQETDTFTVAGGMFNATLGDNRPLGVGFFQDLWLGISVGADPEMAPRTSLALRSRAVHAEVAPFHRLGRYQVVLCGGTDGGHVQRAARG